MKPAQLPEIHEPISFGIGCFYFRPTAPSQTDRPSEFYRQAVRTALERIPNVNNILVEGGEDPDTLLLPLGQDPWPSLEHRARGFAAYPSHVEISFDLYLPERIQRELLAKLSAEPLFVEHFRVFVIHDDMPVAMVVPVGPATLIDDPSNAVVLVRNYLEAQLAGGDVELTFLGPSPFHGDFYLRADATQSEQCHLARERRLGYDRYVCTYNPADLEDSDEALRATMWELSTEFSMFYSVVQARRSQMAEWERIDTAVRSSLLPKKFRGIRGWKRWAKRYLRRGQRLQRLTASLITFEMDRLQDAAHIEAMLSSRYASSERGYLRDELESAKAELGTYPTEQISRLLEFFERRRSESLNLVVALLSAIAGGIVGAWITALVSP